MPGTFSTSDFVRNVTGVDCVCERSAVRLALDHSEHSGHSGKGDEREACLLQEKQSLEGVTAALAIGKDTQSA